MIDGRARRARFLIVALLTCVSTVIAVPVRAMPIARGLPELARMIETTSQIAEPISLIGSVSRCGSETLKINAIRLALLTVAEGDEPIAELSGGADAGTQ